MKNAVKPTPGSSLTSVALGILTAALALGAQSVGGPTEAPTGFDNQTNGATFVEQPDFNFDEALETFSEVEEPDEGLGPVFNNTSCVGCHLSGGAVGGSSQVTVLRAGHYETLRGRWMRSRRDQNEQRRGFASGGTFVPATVQLADGSSIAERSSDQPARHLRGRSVGAYSTGQSHRAANLAQRPG